MAALYNYTDGRLGSHGITMCKPVGGGVIDIENVPTDLANNYIVQGYYQCNEAQGLSGYCIASPDGYSCSAAPSHTEVARAPQALPAVGSDASFIVTAIIAIVVGIVVRVYDTKTKV